MSKVFQGGHLYINGLPAVHAGPGGHATAPELCWVTVGGQRTTQPFMNIAHSKDLTNTTTRIFVNGHPLATLASSTAQSYGDQASEGGVKSGTTAGALRFLTASPTVFLEGNPAVRHGDLIVSNEGNTEPSTWVQPGKHAPAMATLLSDPMEDLPEAFSLNIALLRNPRHLNDPLKVQQYFLVEHEETGHQTFHSFGVFQPKDDHSLWHESIFREGRYRVYEVYAQSISGLQKILLGTIQTGEAMDEQPGLTLVPLSFRRLFENSRITLYKDSALWREFEVGRRGRLFEVDLASQKDKTPRIALGELKQGIFLPLEDAQGRHEFHVEVDTVQGLQEIPLQALMAGTFPTDKLCWHEETPPEPSLDALRPENAIPPRVAGTAIFDLENACKDKEVKP
jgi:uncharacterized Zn-binding protein involved in type VI secretion